MKPLSPNNVINALVFPVLLTITLTLFLLPGGFPYISNPPTTILLYAILSIWIYHAGGQTYDLHYDQEFLYLKSLTRTKQVPLTAIKSVRLSHEGIKVKGLTSWRYILQFHPGTKIGDQTIYEINGSRKVEAFTNIVKQRNSKLFVSLS